MPSSPTTRTPSKTPNQVVLLLLDFQKKNLSQNLRKAKIATTPQQNQRPLLNSAMKKLKSLPRKTWKRSSKPSAAVLHPSE